MIANKPEITAKAVKIQDSRLCTFCGCEFRKMYKVEKIANCSAWLHNSFLPNMLIISLHHRERRAHRGAKRAVLSLFSARSVLSVVVNCFIPSDLSDC